MKKKILSLCLVAALVAVAVVGTTLAYFTDTDNAVNVFTMGNVDIALHEDNGDPASADYKLDDDYRSWLKEQLITPSVPVEKDVWVENIGKNPAYVRVSVLVPVALDPMLVLTWDNASDWTLIANNGALDVDGDSVVDYVGYCYMYNTALESQNTTTDLLTLVTLKDAVTCETLASGDILYELAEGGNTYTFTTPETGISNFIIYAEAGQTVGYTNGVAWNGIEDSLEAMFGAPFSDMKLDVTVSDPADFSATLATAAPGSTITLADGADWSQLNVDTAAKDLTIVPADGVEVKEIVISAEMENLTLSGFEDLGTAGSAYADGAIKVTSAATVTIDNCVFDAPNGYKNSIYADADAEIYVTNSTFDGVRAFWTSASVPAVLSFENCEFKNIDEWVIQHNTTPCDVDVYVNNCVFENCTNGIMKLNSNNNGYINAGHTFTFTNNTLTGILGHDGSESKLFAVNTVNYGATAVFSGNTRDGAAWTPDASNGLNIW